MTLRTFRELLGQRPFKPFRLVMSCRASHEVRHPEMALLTRTDILVGVEHRRGRRAGRVQDLARCCTSPRSSR